MYTIIILAHVDHDDDFEIYGSETEFTPELIQEAKVAEGGIMSYVWEHIETHTYTSETLARKFWNCIHSI